ncbi:transmembrane protein [Tieghemostelium lacteum]|uniref:Transmembrane protein n=1 Tax=Tieghemostelium lacteum TaxID=361077 RepID=A0A151ZJT7_TIELA|nr:transmembrane protein [Tieghemostelium lacteum]|eukprot:KYQ94187.1 transmembrane protein [Tieghemostelium lacteum]
MKLLLNQVIFILLLFFIGDSFEVIVHQYLPGIIVKLPDKNLTKYITFPQVLFDYSSPFENAHFICKTPISNQAKEELIFQSGTVNTYSYNCTIDDPTAISEIFQNKIQFQIDWGLDEGCTCIFPTIDNTTLISGYIITVPSFSLGFTKTYFTLEYCQIEVLYSDIPLKKGDLFEQIIILDGGPKYLSGSVYLFIAIGLFSIIITCCLIGVLCDRWGGVKEEKYSQREFGSIEMKSIECEQTYLNEEEKIQSYLRKVDSQFNQNQE